MLVGRFTPSLCGRVECTARIKADGGDFLGQEVFTHWYPISMIRSSAGGPDYRATVGITVRHPGETVDCTKAGAVCALPFRRLSEKTREENGTNQASVYQGNAKNPHGIHGEAPAETKWEPRKP